MADLYSVIAGIQPDQQDIVEAELLAKQILEANFPDLDLREGTAIRDLVLRPSAFLLSLCKKGFDYYFDQNTLANIDDTSSTELVDNILGNLFLTRNLGSQAVINVRLYFARQKAVSLTTSTSFSTDGALLFFPPISTTYPQTSLQFDSYQNEWYLDLDLLAAEKGSDYNISSGSLLYFSNFDPYFLHAEINYLAQASTSPETNSEFISRASTSISTRNLINKPSIDSILKQDLNYLNRVVVVGAGDAEIYRDQVEVAGSTGVSRSGSAMVFTDSVTKVQVTLAGHGFILGQLVDVFESGIGPGLLYLKRVPVSVVIDAANFKVDLPFSIATRALAAPNVSAVEEDIFIHQGGMVDVHCAEEVITDLRQFTLDSLGRCVVEGPIYKVVQSAVSATSTPDTVPPSTAFTSSFPGHATRGNISLSQSVGGVVTLTMNSHPLVLGRYVNILGWPTSVSNLYLPVTQVIDQDSVILGEDLPIYTIGGGLTPLVRYVYPKSDTGFSTRQELVVDFGSGQAGELVSLELSLFDRMDSIQEYLEVDDNRVICADLLARGFDVYILDINLVVYDIVAPTSGEVFSIVDTFLRNLPAGEELILADMVADITSKGISKLKTPIDITYSHYTKDMFPPQTGTITDVLKPFNSTSVFLVGDVITSFEIL